MVIKLFCIRVMNTSALAFFSAIFCFRQIRYFTLKLLKLVRDVLCHFHNVVRFFFNLMDLFADCHLFRQIRCVGD